MPSASTIARRQRRSSSSSRRITIRRLLAGLAVATAGAFVPCSASGATEVAWVRVAVATVWYRPSSPQPIDTPALENPARIETWLTALTVADRLALDSRISTQVLLGAEVVVTARRGGWRRVEVPDQRGAKYPHGVVGWVPRHQLSTVAPRGSRQKVIVSVPRAWLYRVASGRLGQRRFLVSYDTELPVAGRLPGYVLVGLPGGEEGAIATASLAPVRDVQVSGAAIASQARQFLGLPYLWGGTSAFGYDCSGLVYALYARYGHYLPRDAADQQHAGTPVPLDRLQPGDLLFFAGPGGKGPVVHVAIYVGGGRVVDSPYSGASVEMVPMTALPVWGDFAGAIRVRGAT